MRIAILTPTLYEFSGIDRVVESQAQELAKEGHQVAVVALEATMSIKNTEVIILWMPKTLFWQRIYRLLFFLDIWKIAFGIKALKHFDVIYSHLYPMNILALGAKLFYGKIYIFYNHGVAPEKTFELLHERAYIKIFRSFSNLTARYADEVISISQYLADIFYRETGRKGSVKHNIINHDRFHSGIDRMRIRHRYGIGNNPLVLYVGRLSPHKGIDLLIHAFQKTFHKIPQAKLIIVGKPTFSTHYEKLKNMSGPDIIFVGAVPDEELPYYYAACDVYATASLWEGFDMPLVEAQSCGKPVVAFDIGPHQELINKDGILVSEGNVNSFSRALEKVLTR